MPRLMLTDEHWAKLKPIMIENGFYDVLGETYLRSSETGTLFSDDLMSGHPRENCSTFLKLLSKTRIWNGNLSTPPTSRPTNITKERTTKLLNLINHKCQHHQEGKVYRQINRK